MLWPNELDVCDLRSHPLPELSEDTVIFHIERPSIKSSAHHQEQNPSLSQAHLSSKQASQLILRQLLGYYLNTPASKIQFNYGDKGKPYLANNPLFFNASDTEHALCIALNRSTEVGLDIEPNSRQLNYQMLIQRHFSPSDQQRYSGVEKDDQRYWTLFGWTRKEALGKAMGLGIRYPMREFSLMGAFPRPDSTSTEITAYNISSFQLTHINAIGSIAQKSAEATPITKLIHIGAEQWQNLIP